MRAGIAISAVSHVVLVALALLCTPQLFEEGATRSIETEIVSEEDAPPQPKLDVKPEKPPEPQPVIPPAQLSTKDAAPQQAERRAQTKAPPPPQAKQAPPQPQQAPQQSASATQAAPPAAAAPPAPPAAQPTPSIFDPASIPALLDLPNAPAYGFDAVATTVAVLSGDEKAALKAQLRKCWKLPGSVSPTQTTRVVMRVYLQPDGALASEPILVEASASRDGPALVKAAIGALTDCQPFSSLPADKYREWKVLDLSFSPREMAGG